MAEMNPVRVTASQRTIAMVTATTVLVGVANYGMSLVLVQYLPAREFSEFAAAQGLLLVLGTGSIAALPWAVARYLASAEYEGSRAKAMWFGLIGSALQAGVLGAIALVTCWFLSGAALGLVCGAATAAISMLAGPTGYLQGSGQLAAIAAMRTVETGLRIGVSLALTLVVAHSAVLALLGFPVGTAIALGYALWRGREAFPVIRLERSTALILTRQAALLGGIQVLLAMLAALDTVYLQAGGFGVTAAASYQSAALLGRIPLFFSSALSIACYTSLVSAPDDATTGTALRGSLRMYAWLCAPFLVACMTMPGALLFRVVPPSYTQTLAVLKISCFTGVIVGAINVITTAHQARGRFRQCIAILAVGVSLQAAALIGAGIKGSVIVFAGAALAVAGLTALWLVADAACWLTRPTWRSAARATPAIPLAVLVFTPLPTAGWLVVVAAFSLASARRAMKEPAIRSPRHLARRPNNLSRQPRHLPNRSIPLSASDS